MRTISREGYTILELVIVVTISAVVLAVAIPPARLVLDRLSVHAAASDVAVVLSTARTLALTGHAPVAVDIDAASGVLRIRRGVEMLASRNVGQAHGVQVERTRDSLTYDPRGLGRGAANLSVIVRRRSAVETVFVSRLGRVR
jgi:prepilin-type N-terminal cleavage/methylation domain-containing protein